MNAKQKKTWLTVLGAVALIGSLFAAPISGVVQVVAGIATATIESQEATE